MISKRYYNNWLREAGRGHLVAVLSWGAFLFYLMAKLTDLSLGDEAPFFGIASRRLPWISAALGLLLAFVEFFYLFQEKKQDFYFSLPVKKNTVFWSRYVHGVLQFMFPFLITQGICSVATAVKAARFLPYAWPYLAKSIGTFTLVFLLFYHIGILASVISGRVSSAVLTAVLFLFGFQTLLGEILPGLAKCFFASFYQIPLLEKIETFLAPFALMGELTGMELYEREEVWNYLAPWRILAAAIIWICLLLMVAVFLYKKRKAETTGKVFASKAAERTVEIAASCLFGLWLGKLAVTLTGAAGRGFLENGAVKAAFLLAASGVFGSVMVHLFIEWLVLMPKKNVFRRKGQIVLVGMIVCGTAVLFAAFRNPFDSFTPELSQTQSISLSVNGIDMTQEEYEMVRTTDDYQTVLRLQRFTLEDEGKEEALYWTRELVERALAGEIEEADVLTAVTVCFRTQDKGSRYRTYPVDQTAIADFAKVYQAEEYKQKAYPLTAEKELEKERLTWTDGVTDTVMKLTPEEKNTFLAVYKRDVMKMEMQDMTGVFPSGIVKVAADGRGVHASAVVYPFFEETMQFLKAHEVQTDKTLADYSISSIQVEKGNKGFQRGVSFYTEEKEVAAWAKKLVPKELTVQPVLCPVDRSVQAEAEAEDEHTGSAVIVKCYGRYDAK